MKGFLEGSFSQGAVFPHSLRMPFTSPSVRGSVISLVVKLVEFVKQSEKLKPAGSGGGNVDVEVVGSSTYRHRNGADETNGYYSLFVAVGDVSLVPRIRPPPQGPPGTLAKLGSVA